MYDNVILTTEIPVRETPGCEIQLEVDQPHNEAKQDINEYLCNMTPLNDLCGRKVYMCKINHTCMTEVIRFLTRLTNVRRDTIKKRQCKTDQLQSSSQFGMSHTVSLYTCQMKLVA